MRKTVIKNRRIMPHRRLHSSHNRKPANPTLHAPNKEPLQNNKTITKFPILSKHIVEDPWPKIPIKSKT